MSDEAKDLYVSAVEGHLVQRFGTGLYIGAERDTTDPSKITWRKGEVAKISEAELAAYPREYSRALRDGSLVKRTREDHDGFVKAQAETSAADAPKPTKPKTGPARGAGDKE